MSTDSSSPSISGSARRLRLAVFAAMAVMLLIYLAARFDLHLPRLQVEYRHGSDTAYARPIADVSLALLLMALFRLTQMLRLIAGGELFTPGVVRHFRGFAWWLLLMALFQLAAPLAAEFATVSRKYPHLLRLTLDMRDLLTVGTTLLLFLLARLLERARRLDDEMREFV